MVQSGLEKLAWDKHSSLQQKLVNYGQKSFVTLAPGSIVVKHLTHNPNIKDSNPPICTGERIGEKSIHRGGFVLVTQWLNNGLMILRFKVQTLQFKGKAGAHQSEAPCGNPV
jgi:hypothetical protein